MKKIINLVVTLLLISFCNISLTAQIEKGKKIIGASSNLGYTSTSSSNGTPTGSNFNLNFLAGILLSNHF